MTVIIFGGWRYTLEKWTVHITSCLLGGWSYTPKKWKVHRIMRRAHDVMCTVHFFGGIPPSTEKLLQLLLII